MSAEDPHRSAARRIAVLLEYGGGAYRGSQYQENGPSIQRELETAVEHLTGAPARATFAGRTDAGVHALGQVAAFDTAAALTLAAFVRGLNHFLPADIAVQAAADVAPSFDPRRDAVGRTYRYRIDNRPSRSPLTRGRAWQVRRPLDVAAMRAAARTLVGRHDFAAFAGPYDGPTARTLRRCDVTARGPFVMLTMEAEAFLPQQVRRSAGVLARAGHGQTDADAVRTLLEEARPCSAEPVAPACGLYLLRVAYDGLDFGPCVGARGEE